MKSLLDLVLDIRRLKKDRDVHFRSMHHAKEQCDAAVALASARAHSISNEIEEIEKHIAVNREPGELLIPLPNGGHALVTRLDPGEATVRFFDAKGLPTT